jgi:hypothetical protein
MATRFLTPISTCSLVGSSAASVKGYVWLGLMAPVDQTACAAFYAGSSTADKSEANHIWSLAASKGTAIGPVGPFQTADCAVYADVTGTRASALIATG